MVISVCLPDDLILGFLLGQYEIQSGFQVRKMVRKKSIPYCMGNCKITFVDIHLMDLLMRILAINISPRREVIL